MKEIPSEAPLPQISGQQTAVPHQPSRKQAVGFFIFSVVAAAFIVAWVFFINKGTVLVEGPLPFTASMGGEEKECREAPCEFRLSPKKYGAVLQKDGFFDDTQTVEVRRWRTITVTPDFIFIPVVREADKTKLPSPNTPPLPPFLKKAAFPNTWAAGRLIFLDTSEEPHTLKEWKNEKTAKLMSFERPFRNPVLAGAQTFQKILIQEENGFYLIDLEKRSRKKLDALNHAVAAKWVGNFIVFEESEGGIRRIAALHDDLQTRTDIASEKEVTPSGRVIGLAELRLGLLENIAELEPGIFVFFSDKKLDETAPKIGPSIDEALEEGRKEFEALTEGTAATPSRARTLYLTQFDIAKNSHQTLANIEMKDDEKINRLTAALEEKKLYFMKGEKVFEVILTQSVK